MKEVILKLAVLALPSLAPARRSSGWHKRVDGCGVASMSIAVCGATYIELLQ
jgi:hypothetical protein